MHECLLPMYIYGAMALHCTVTCSPLVESHWACGTGLLVDHTNMADKGLTTPEMESMFVSCSASIMGSGLLICPSDISVGMPSLTPNGFEVEAGRMGLL